MTRKRLREVQEIYKLFMEDPSHRERQEDNWLTNKRSDLQWAAHFLDNADRDLRDVKSKFSYGKFDKTTSTSHHPYELNLWSKLKDARSGSKEAQRIIEGVECTVTPIELKGWSWY